MAGIDGYFEEVERRAWQSYENAKTLYHIAQVDNIQRIRTTTGILSGETANKKPAIWFFTEKDWAGGVARSIGMYEFALFSISKKAIEWDLIHWDNAAEFCAVVSFYCIKDCIPPNYISLVGCYRIGESIGQKLG